MALILSLDVHGNPQKWVTWQDAVTYQAKDQVAWSMGENHFTFHGGISRLTGEVSEITTPSIIAVRCDHGKVKYNHKTPTLTNKALFRRDRCVCAYCGNHFSMDTLTRDHIIPRCQKGQDTSRSRQDEKDFQGQDEEVQSRGLSEKGEKFPFFFPLIL